MKTHSRLKNKHLGSGFLRRDYLAAAAAIVLSVMLFFPGAGGTTNALAQRVTPLTSWCKCTPPTSEQRRITVLFKGLFYFSIPNGTAGQPREECRVGILSSREDHVLSVTYNDIALTIPNSLLQSLGDITIEKKVATGPAPPAGITICGYDGGTGWGPLQRRIEKPTEGDERYYHFNWIIDFEGSELHAEDIPLRPNRLRPLLHFRTGDFYTETISDHEYLVFQNGVWKRFGYVAATIGACITLERNEWLEIGGGGISPPLRIDSTATVLLANVRPEDQEYVRQFALKKVFVQHSRDTGIHDRRAHPDEITIFYEDLLGLREPGRRAFFIPLERLTKSDPFVCYGGGGSVFP